MGEEIDYGDLPETQTQECCDILSQESQEPVKPWGRLSALTPIIKSIDLYDQYYIIGRDRNTCNIVIECPNLPYFLNISKAHFKISEQNDIVYLTDLSKNGTFVNYKKVGRNKKNIIHSGDIISLGHPKDRVYMFGCNLHDILNLPQQLRKKYFVERLLGRGAVGEVRFALDKETCKEYAIKRIVKGSSYSANLNHPQKIKTEIEILKKLSHPFVIQMKDFYDTENEVFLILEFMRGGALTQRIISVKPLVESEAKFIFYQMVLAVQYLHKQGITHRDLKPDNVLMASEDEYPMIKISDFGLSKIMDEISAMETKCGTLNYVAPEIVNQKGKYTSKVDIWSLGVILFYMLCKELPFIADEKIEIVNNIITGMVEWNDKRWGTTSFAGKDLVKKMLNVNPTKRIGIDEIIKHPWIKQDFEIKYKIETLIHQNQENDQTSIYQNQENNVDEDSSDDIFSPPEKKWRGSVPI